MQTYPDLWRGYIFDYNQDEDLDIVIHLEFSTFNIIKNKAGSRIHAEGKSEEGNFLVKGTQKDQNSFQCEYKSIKRTLFLILKLNNDGQKLEGNWGSSANQVQNDRRIFIDRIQQTQGWNGYYVHFDVATQMKFEKFIIQAAPGGKVQAHGSDPCGPFVIKGQFNPAINEVFFLKTYENGVKWDYWGCLKNNEVQGQWGWKKPESDGNFRLYYLN